MTISGSRLRSRTAPQLAMHTQQQSPFFTKPPPELRVRVYKMAIESKSDVVELEHLGANVRDPNSRSYFRGTPSNLFYNNLEAAAPPSSALLRTCQWIHQESVDIFDAAAQARQHQNVTVLYTHWRTHGVPVREREVSHSYLGRIRNLTVVIEHSSMVVRASFRRSQTLQGNWDCDAAVVPDRTDMAALALDMQKLMHAYLRLVTIPLERQQMREFLRGLSIFRGRGWTLCNTFKPGETPPS